MARVNESPPLPPEGSVKPTYSGIRPPSWAAARAARGLAVASRDLQADVSQLQAVARARRDARGQQRQRVNDGFAIPEVHQRLRSVARDQRGGRLLTGSEIFPVVTNQRLQTGE